MRPVSLNWVASTRSRPDCVPLALRLPDFGFDRGGRCRRRKPERAGRTGFTCARGACSTLRLTTKCLSATRLLRRIGCARRAHHTDSGRTQRSVHRGGVVASPEFLYQIKPGAMFPDYERYAIVWFNRRALEAARHAWRIQRAGAQAGARCQRVT